MFIGFLVVGIVLIFCGEELGLNRGFFAAGIVLGETFGKLLGGFVGLSVGFFGLVVGEFGDVIGVALGLTVVGTCNNACGDAVEIVIVGSTLMNIGNVLGFSTGEFDGFRVFRTNMFGFFLAFSRNGNTLLHSLNVPNLK
jgi:hypothetical protein